jgi:hypothetical protein
MHLLLYSHVFGESLRKFHFWRERERKREKERERKKRRDRQAGARCFVCSCFLAPERQRDVGITISHLVWMFEHVAHPLISVRALRVGLA